VTNTISYTVGPDVMEVNIVRSHSSGQSKGPFGRSARTLLSRGSISIISDVPGFRVCYVTYAPDHMATAISTFNDYANAEESIRCVLAWIEQNLAPLLTGPATAVAGPVIVHTLA